MFDRTKAVEDKLLTCIKGNFLNKREVKSYTVDDHQRLKLIEIFESQITSRLLDLKARKLRTEGKSFYTIGSSGHEVMAVVGELTRLTDMAFLHYRDAALLIQRSKKHSGHTVLFDLMLSFCAGKEDPISGGRHKVLGHKNLHIPPQTSTIASHLPKALGAAYSIYKAKKLNSDYSVLPGDGIVVCSFGDASFNHASAQTTFNCAQWMSFQKMALPLLFICEDNGIGISVKTPNNWIREAATRFSSIQYFECNGLDLIESYAIVQEAIEYTRIKKRPAFLRIKTVRLMGHAGSDIEMVYRTLPEIDNNENSDPLIQTIDLFLKNNILTLPDIQKIYKSMEERIDRVATLVLTRPKLQDAEEIKLSVVPHELLRENKNIVDQEKRKLIFEKEWDQLSQPQTMGKMLNWGLTDILHFYKEAVIFGEDVGKKGGVYNITANLQKRFGITKIFDTLLDETNILGTAIGLAHNGILPIPEIQFLAYVHNAEDQIRGEAATLSYFSNGQYTNGMVIRVAGLAYQKGFGGHFHNDNSIAIFRDIPGVIIACPSKGDDAVLMFRACVEAAYQYGRVCIFIEPIALYTIRDLHNKGDGLWLQTYPVDFDKKIGIGEFHHQQGDKKLCIVSYANGYYLSNQAAETLKSQLGLKVGLVDLRWIAPLKEVELIEVIGDYENVLIVDECRKTGSISEALLSLFYERCPKVPKMKRLCSEDVFIPLGDAANNVLVQTEQIIAAAKLLIGKS